MSFFCYQCEQTARGEGCSVQSNCGKDEPTALLQDLLVHQAKGVAQLASRAAAKGDAWPAADVFILEALFTTVTNVNFDPQRLVEILARGSRLLEEGRALVAKAEISSSFAGPEALRGASDLKSLLVQARVVGILSRQALLGPEAAGLQELALYGLKGAAAYAQHARMLGQESPEIHAGFRELLSWLAKDPSSTDELFSGALKVGELNYRVMELLDRAHTGAYGHPVPTKVRTTAVAGKAILVSGHDLKDLEELLVQTEGRGVNVYTHGEMLPAHGYPGLHRFKHLVGNYGTAWQNQQKEFARFPGAILMTTNCIQKPMDGYFGRIFTSGLVAWPGVRHVGDRDFSPVIEAALSAPGFPADEPGREILVGFAHEAVMGVAGPVVEAVKAGRIRHFLLVGGCDGAKPGRNYYTDIVEKAPKDTVVLTLACGKYRFNHLDLGDAGGIPRLLDVGQCNDAYSAVQIALALSKAFQVGVNELPLSLVLSWYEQKAVAVLLTMLHLGLKGIRLGPTLPAFVTPPVLKVLQERFALKPVTTAAKDLEAILGKAG
jgi:hydroxylamine reductase